MRYALLALCLFAGCVRVQHKADVNHHIIFEPKPKPKPDESKPPDSTPWRPWQP
jgi:hypothetical protein